MLRWGVLGTAKIAREKVIPAIQATEGQEVTVIGSRNLDAATKASSLLNISKAVGSYEEVLADDSVDAVYIPLPNDLHLPWTLKAIEAGKHVLCEKPITLNTKEIDAILEAKRDRDVLVSEGFMLRTHPLWLEVKDRINDGDIGELLSIVGVFSYFNTDPKNIRNQVKHGGGALFDIGCYCVNIARWLFDSEPIKVSGALRRSADFGVDELTSGLLEFEKGHAIFTSSTRMVPQQNIRILGSEGVIEVPIPFNIPRFVPTTYTLDKSGSRDGSSRMTSVIEICDQYQTQAVNFNELLKQKSFDEPLFEARKNMRVIDRIFENE